MSNQDVLGEINFADVSEFSQGLAAGVYDTNINSVKVDTDTKGENGAERTFVSFTFKVVDGPFNGMTQPEKIMVPSFYSKLKSILGHVGFDVNGSINIRQLIATDALLGKPIKIVVTETPSNREGGRPYTNVSGYEKSERKAGGAPAGGGSGLPGLPSV